MEKRKRKRVSFFSSQQWESHRARRSANGKEDVYEVEDIIRMRLHKGRTEFYIKWKGYPDECNTWEPQKNLKNCSRALKDFEKRQRGAGDDAYEEVKALPGLPEDGGTSPDNAGPLRLAPKATTGGGSPEADFQVQKIIKAMSYATTQVNGERDLKVMFKVLRSDGEEVMMDNKFLRDKYPYLLLDFYEQRVRHGNH